MLNLKKIGLIGLVTIFFLVSSFLVVCGAGSQKSVSNNWEWPKSMTMGTLMSGTSNQVAMASWVPLMEKSTGMKIRMLSESNYPLAGRWLKQNVISSYVFTETNYIEELTANKGYATREGGPNPMARLLWLGQVGYSAYLVRADSNVKTPYDLRGKKFSYPKGYTSVERLNKALLAWGNITTDDIIIIPFSDYGSHIRGFLNGKADICLCNPMSPQAYEAEGIPGGILWLDLNPKKDPEGAARFWEIVPERNFGECTLGVESAKSKWVITAPFYIYTSLSNIDEDLGYHMAKWLNENFDLYKDDYISNQTMDINLVMDNIKNSLIPVHEGTKRYLDELGKWDEDLELQYKDNLELLNTYYVSYQEAINLADNKGIKVDPDNIEWIELWENYQNEKNIKDIWKK